LEEIRHSPADRKYSSLPIQYHFRMAFPIKTCAVCGEEFELKPGKPGFANRCPECSVQDDPLANDRGPNPPSDSELSAARRKAMRDLLYRKDS